MRERLEDIATLTRYFIDRFCRELKKKPLMLSPAAEDELRAYPWPGNVRELQNCIERAAILTEGDTIHPRHLSLSFRDAPRSPTAEGDESTWARIRSVGHAGRCVAPDDLAEVEKAEDRTGAEGEPDGNSSRAAEQVHKSATNCCWPPRIDDYGLA